jgi:probable rRNA maturation factor
MPWRTPTRYKINLKIDSAFRDRIDSRDLRAAARLTLLDQKAPVPGELSLLVTGEATLQTLNRDYLGHDRPTDVLSFPADETDPETGRHYYGDIAISFPQARAQAARAGHRVQAELQLLVVHGVLHLLGHDHADRGARNRMWTEQAAILTRLKTGTTGPAGV